MSKRLHIEGYAVVSDDGMLAGPEPVMPPELMIPADQQFFEQQLNTTDVVVHGRNSQESHPNSPRRRRIVVTRQVTNIAPHADNKNAVLWNPAGASVEDACAALGLHHARIGILGGTDVFGLFLPRYDVFYLSRAAHIRLPGGRPVFPAVPRQTPDEVLTLAGMRPVSRELLDAKTSLTLVTWTRGHHPQDE